MSEFVEVYKTGELKDGEMTAVRAGKREILLARIGNDYFAVANRCPHLGASLAKGELEGNVVTCPAHGSRFDIRDGKVIRWTKWSGLRLGMVKLLKHPRPLNVYAVKVEGDTVYVKV
ncbi:Rieske (2Fe-2S) protein [Chloroflexota bacterium]